MRQYLLPGPDQAVAIALFDMAALNFLNFNDFYFLTDEIILKQLVLSSYFRLGDYLGCSLAATRLRKYSSIITENKVTNC